MNLDLLDIYLTTFFGVRNFGNTSGMRVFFFKKNAQNLMYISKMQKEIEKLIFVSEIIPSQLAALIVAIKKRVLVISSQ